MNYSLTLKEPILQKVASCSSLKVSSLSIEKQAELYVLLLNSSEGESVAWLNLEGKISPKWLRPYFSRWRSKGKVLDDYNTVEKVVKWAAKNGFN